MSILPKTKYIWMDGKMVLWDEARIHILTHSLHYGGAVFEGIRCYETTKGPAIFRLEKHTDRLFYSAEAIEMKVPFSKKEIIEAVREVVRKNEVKSCYIRPIIYYGYGKMGLNPTGAPVNVSIACWPWGAYLGDKPVRIKTSKYIRIHPASTIADAKISGHYVNSILASLEIQNHGYDEALFLDFKGNVAEGPGENIFIVKNGKISTPPLGAILAGITRDSVITLIKDLKIPFAEKILLPADILSVDEAFFTGTAAEVTAIGEMDNKKIGSGNAGKITKRLRDEFMKIVKGENEKYKKWLTIV